MAPKLETERLSLRAWRKNDFAPYAQFCADENMMTYVGGTKSLAEAWTNFCAMIGEWSVRGMGTFAVEERASGATAGYAGLWFPIDLEEPELCWSLFQGFHGKGYAQEAARRVQVWAAEELGLPPLMNFAHPGNVASHKVARRLGATCLGETILRGAPRLFFRHADIGSGDGA